MTTDNDGAPEDDQTLATSNHTDPTTLRDEIAVRFGIDATDRDLFMSATDEATLTAQASRLAEQSQRQLVRGNVAPREGQTVYRGTRSSDDVGEFTRQLFGQFD